MEETKDDGGGRGDDAAPKLYYRRVAWRYGVQGVLMIGGCFAGAGVLARGARNGFLLAISRAYCTILQGSWFFGIAQVTHPAATATSARGPPPQAARPP